MGSVFNPVDPKGHVRYYHHFGEEAEAEAKEKIRLKQYHVSHRSKGRHNYHNVEFLNETNTMQNVKDYIWYVGA
jgi:hypothetical protein